MRSIRLAGVAVLAVFAISAVTASAAFATGPVWKVAGTELKAGQTKAITAKQKTSFTLTAGSLITVLCDKATSSGEIIGGVPGTDKAKITFSECVVKGFESTCHVNSPGEEAGTIFTEAKTELVYIGSSEQAEKLEGPIGDLFSPASGTTFVTLEVGGSSCPALTKGTNKVEGSVIAKVEPYNTEAKSGTLNFPSSPVTTGYLWSGGELIEDKPTLKVFGVVGCTQVGEELVELESGQEYGAWDV